MIGTWLGKNILEYPGTSLVGHPICRWLMSLATRVSAYPQECHTMHDM